MKTFYFVFPMSEDYDEFKLRTMIIQAENLDIAISVAEVHGIEKERDGGIFGFMVFDSLPIANYTMDDLIPYGD